MIGAAGQPYPDTKIELPFGRYVEIDGREYLVFLFTYWIKPAEWPQSTVVLNSRVDLLRNRIRDFDVGRKLEPAFRSRTVQRALKSGIERDVPATQIFVDDRTNLPAPGVLREFAPHVTDLLRETYAHRPMPFFRHPKTRSNMRAHEIQTTAIAGAGKDIEAGFKPVVEAVSDLDGLVPGVIRRQGAVAGLLRSFSGEVVVQLNHRHTARNGFRSIDLDFIIALAVSDRGEEAKDCAPEY